MLNSPSAALFTEVALIDFISPAKVASMILCLYRLAKSLRVHVFVFDLLE